MKRVEKRLRKAKELLKAEEYDKARRILKKLDHPDARKWLVKLDEVAPEKPNRRRRNIVIASVVFTLACCGVLAALPPVEEEIPPTLPPETATAQAVAAANQTATQAALPTATMTMTPTITLSPTITNTVPPTLTRTPAPTLTPIGYIRQEDWGENWAFTVPEGRMACLSGNHVVFIADGVTYAINGTARGSGDYVDGDVVWRDAPGIMPKVDIGPFIQTGLSLCRGSDVEAPTPFRENDDFMILTVTEPPGFLSYDPPRNWYSQGANFRSCPELTDECDEGRTLITGQPIIVLGEVEGAAWGGSRTWYYVEVDNEVGFVHSALVTETAARSTNTPAPATGQQFSSGDASSNGNSVNDTGNTQRPANCADAVAMGLSAREAAQWPHLDRDNDGVACYGD